MIFGTIISFHFLFRFINESFQIIFSMDILAIFSIWINELNIFSLFFELLNFFFLLLEIFSSLNLLIVLFFFILTLHFDSFKEFKVIFSLSKLIIDGFFERLHTSHDFDTFFELSFLFILHFGELNILLWNGNVT